MLSTDLTLSSAYADPETSASRLIVTRRGVEDRTYRAIGYLDRRFDSSDVPVFEFTYLAKVAECERFVPIIGFRDVCRHYHSRRLFPSFAERVISAKRPDRPEYLAALDLSEDADAWEILTASGGYREGDPIELISLPTYDRMTGETTAHFLSHGVRYCEDKASDHITGLKAGDRLTLRPDTSNETDPRAIKIVDETVSLGYVPRPLLDYVHSVVDAGDHKLIVVRSNPAETHPHLRLLLRLEGRCGEFVFDRPEWRSA
ncbi:HIRAN domain-containing protein [Nocardia carnea]|uniref:HIRAN domain-containing protein n=1 Tax=Nocardia carnea TaxID=37328 RepID=UPI002455D086|nr:HIRAN domain-containing protein [Nocardia carnea]